MKEKMSFVEWLLEVQGISWNEWDENYSPSSGQGKEIYAEYEEYMEK